MVAVREGVEEAGGVADAGLANGGSAGEVVAEAPLPGASSQALWLGLDRTRPGR